VFLLAATFAVGLLGGVVGPSWAVPVVGALMFFLGMWAESWNHPPTIVIANCRITGPR